MAKILLVTGPTSTGKTNLLMQAQTYAGWRCKLYDGMAKGEAWEPPQHPLEVELVAIDHVSAAPAHALQQVVQWCVANGVALLLAEHSRVDIERVLGPLAADELKLSGGNSDAIFLSASGSRECPRAEFEELGRVVAG